MVATTNTKKIKGPGMLATLLGAAVSGLGIDSNGVMSQMLGAHYGPNNRNHLPKPTLTAKRQTPEEKQAAVIAAEKKRQRKREKNKCIKL